MSQFPVGTDPTNTFASQPPPSHHVHHSSDVLPGARGSTQAAPDYSTDVTADARVWQGQSRDERDFGPGSDTRQGVAREHELDDDDTGGRGMGIYTGAPGATGTGMQHEEFGGHNAWNEERPLGVKPTEQGGVAIGGNPNLPEGHASMADKIIGKTQKLTGKLTHNPDMHEKGELRESGGKLAAQGQARAPHD